MPGIVVSTLCGLSHFALTRPAAVNTILISPHSTAGETEAWRNDLPKESVLSDSKICALDHYMMSVPLFLHLENGESEKT